MAKNTGDSNENKRIAVKYIRDKAKAAYDKKDTCYICGTSDDLELHHLNSITLLLNAWAKRKSYDISTDAGILEVRDEFIAEHKVELYDLVYTLCNKHHVKLHSIYGKAPPQISVDRQKRWIEIQKAKQEGGDEYKTPSASLFSNFY